MDASKDNDCLDNIPLNRSRGDRQTLLSSLIWYIPQMN